MNNREVATIISFFMITLIVLGFIQWSSGESMPCMVGFVSVICDNAEGYFLTHVRSENILSIIFRRSSLIHLYEQDFSKFTNLSGIIIDECEVPSRVLTYILSLKQLTMLQIIHSNLTANYFPNLKNSRALVTLSFEGNEIFYLKKGSFKNLSRLEEIDLSHNKMRNIQADAFEGLAALRKLDISYNMLTGVFDHSANKRIFKNLSHLEEIDLSHNEITTIEADAFEGLTALRRLDLSQNRLSDDFDPASLSLPVSCAFQSLVATCTKPTMNDLSSDEHQRPAQSTTTDDPLEKHQPDEQQEAQQQQPEQQINQQQEQQQQPEQEVNQQEDNQQHPEEKVNQQQPEQQVNQQEERHQQEQHQEIKLQQKLQELQEQLHQQQQKLDLLMAELGKLQHSGSRRENEGSREEDVGHEDIAKDASGDSATTRIGGGLSIAMVGMVILLNLVCTILLLTLFETKFFRHTLSKGAAEATTTAT